MGFPPSGDQFEADGSANFVCAGPGTDAVTLTVAGGKCSLTESVALTCSFCGDGVVESGEDCDPAPNASRWPDLVRQHLSLCRDVRKWPARSG